MNDVEERRRSRRDAAIVLAIALVVRLAVAVWAAPRFPATADGVFYKTIADRIAHGLGYTWLWPDGAITYAAHYPVGYPALVAAAEAIFGTGPLVAMTLNAVLGALGAFAAHRLAARAGHRGVALAAGILVALHPGLVAYTPAFMTEGATASLIAIAAWLAARAREATGNERSARVAVLGAAIGLATLVRPQSLILAPLFAAILLRDKRAAFVATAAALLMCAPWTARNCVRMKSCALVSVNGGWNLLIGADAASTGAWSEIKVPAECRDVFDEAEKDQCFGAAARRFIVEHPREWAGLAPKKLAATFDYAGAAPWYLHASNPEVVSDRGKVILAAVETGFERIALLIALVFAARAPGPLRRTRWALAGAAAVFVFLLHAWVAYVSLAALLLIRPRAPTNAPVLPAATAIVIATTALVHAVFFGSGRYSLVVFPLVTACAMLAFLPRSRDFDTEGSRLVPSR